MPFKSEKQRRYLWANEPEIAKDWTEEYGSTPVKKKVGGVVQTTVKPRGFNLMLPNKRPITKIYQEITMVGKIMSRPEKRKTPGKKMSTTTYKSGGRVKKMGGGAMKQGYNARLDESMGARNGSKTQSMAARRNESKGMEKAMGKGAYSGAKTMAAKGGRIKKSKGGTTRKKQFMEDVTAIYVILKRLRTRKEELREIIAAGLPSMDEYAKAVGEHKAYTIMEQEIQDLQKDEDNNDREGTAQAQICA